MSIVVVPEFAVLCVTVAWILLFALLLAITNVIPSPAQAPLERMERSLRYWILIPSCHHGDHR